MPIALSSVFIGYLTVEVCLNGHLTTGRLELEPLAAARFCQQCGAETIQVCPNCGEYIRGDFERSGTGVEPCRVPPKHCHNCGAAFPWAAAKLAAAKEHAGELDGLDG
jgi:hypothetical protein